MTSDIPDGGGDLLFPNNGDGPLPHNQGPGDENPQNTRFRNQPGEDDFDPRVHPPSPPEDSQSSQESDCDPSDCDTVGPARTSKNEQPLRHYEQVEFGRRIITEAHNHPCLPQIYNLSGQLVVLEKGEYGCVSKFITKHEHLKELLSRCAEHTNCEPKKTVTTFSVNPPDKICKAILADPGTVPKLKGLTNKPILREDGSIHQDQGYDSETGYYFDRGEMPPIIIPSHPSAAEVEEAKERILRPFKNFCFNSETDLANYLGLLITLIVRLVIPGNVPLFVITSPIQGSGKSKLAFCASLIATAGREAPMVMPERGGDDEIRKRLTAHLMNNPLTGMLDNLTGKVDWPSLASILTTGLWSDRLLQKSTMVNLLVKTVFFCTGVNIEIAGDLSRRCVYINLDPGVDKPWERTFAFDPEVYVREHRAELLESLFTLVRWWFDQGKPRWVGTPFGSFENWAGIVGGILQSVGINGFLANRNAVDDAAVRENAELAMFFAAWVGVFNHDPQRAAEVARLLSSRSLKVETIRQALPDEMLPIFDREEGNAGVRFGRALSKLKNRVAGGYKLVSNKGANNTLQWCILPVIQEQMNGGTGGTPGGSPGITP